MLKGRLTGIAVVLCALSLIPAAAAQAVPKPLPVEKRYWLGPYFAGLELTRSDERRIGYGGCNDFFEGDCPRPIDISTHPICWSNPLTLHQRPEEVFALRGGGLAAVRDEGSIVEVGTGGVTVSVHVTELELMGAVLREIRPRTSSAPAPLAPPAYPMPVLRELVRVTSAAEKVSGVDAIAKATGLETEEVSMRLRVAELLGPDALAKVPPPTMSAATVERLQKLASRARYNPRKTARRAGLSMAELRRKIDRVRGLSSNC